MNRDNEKKGLGLGLSSVIRSEMDTKKEKGLRGTRRTRATDDMPWSPKTNSVSPASCGIASLARQGLVNPNPTTVYTARDDGHQSFLEGTVLNSAHGHVGPLW